MHAINVIGSFIVDVIMWTLQLAAWISTHLPALMIAGIILAAVILSFCFFILRTGLDMFRRPKSFKE